VAELRYGTLPKLEQRMKEEDERLANQQVTSRLLKEEVDEEDIAEVVSRWTGIPLNRLMQGEVEKLLHLDDRR
jgi:ATP-dependent Clp protease ATP-binding subunit ClpB